MALGVECALSRKPDKAAPAFKGFGSPPATSKAKKRAQSQQSKSQSRHLSRLSRRGGAPHHVTRLETKEDAQRRIQARAAQQAELTVLSEDSQSQHSAPYGPRGLLLVGFEEDDFQAVQDWFGAMEPGFRVSCSTDDFLQMPVSEAVTQADQSFRDQPVWQGGSELVPHVALFSGLSQDEYLAIIQYWEETGIKQPIFASATESMASKELRTALLEISRAYARSLKPEEDNSDQNLTRDSLRQILRERMEAKAKGENQSSPIVI